MKNDEYGKSFADTLLQKADHLVSMASIRLDLAAARQRMDRALLSLGEATFKQANDASRIDPLPSSLDNAVEHVRRTLQDCERLQDKLDSLRDKRNE